MKRGGHEDGMICSVIAYIAYRIGTYTCMPYVYNWSQDVEKCTLDLVLSSSTRTNAVQAIAVASKGCWFFLLDPLALASALWLCASGPRALGRWGSSWAETGRF